MVPDYGDTAIRHFALHLHKIINHHIFSIIIIAHVLIVITNAKPDPFICKGYNECFMMLQDTLLSILGFHN